MFVDFFFTPPLSYVNMVAEKKRFQYENRMTSQFTRWDPETGDEDETDATEETECYRNGASSSIRVYDYETDNIITVGPPPSDSPQEWHYHQVIRRTYAMGPKRTDGTEKIKLVRVYCLRERWDPAQWVPNSDIHTLCVMAPYLRAQTHDWTPKLYNP